MAKIDLAAEVAEVAPYEQAPTPPAAKKAAPRKAAKKRKPKPVKVQEPAADGELSPREQARQIAAERYGVETAPAKTRAERQRERRRQWVQLSTEISAEHSATLDVLAAEAGSIKAAVSDWLQTETERLAGETEG